MYFALGLSLVMRGGGGADSSENRGRWDRRTKCDEVGGVSGGSLRLMVPNRMFRSLIL